MKKIIPVIAALCLCFANMRSQNLVYSHLSGSGGLWKVTALNPSYTDQCLWTSTVTGVGDIMGIGGDLTNKYIYGFYRLSSKNWGLYRYNTIAGTETSVKNYGGAYVFYNADYDNNNNILYTVGIPNGSVTAAQTLYKVNTTNGALTAVCNLPFTGTSTHENWAQDGAISGLAYDHSTNMIYLSASLPSGGTFSNMNLYLMNPGSCATTLIGNMGKSIQGLTWDNSLGKLYGITTNDLYEINTTNAAATNITTGTLSLSSGWGMGLGYAPWAYGGNCGGVPAPGAFNISVTSASVICNGQCTGYATATASGGSSPYAYSWNNSKTTATISGLCAGTYVVTVTDNSGTTQQSTVVIKEPSALSSASFQNNISCYGSCTGTFSITTSGGTPAYSYLWNNGKTRSALSGLCAGSYSVTVTDKNGCTATSSGVILQASAITNTITATTTICGQANGAAEVIAAGGTPGFSYNWSNGATTSQISNLASQIYSVTITDAAGCTKTGSAQVGNFPGVNIQTQSLTPVSCNGKNNGFVSVIVTGGSSPYFYLWNTGVTVSHISNLISQIYSVTVTDINGCTSTSSFNISQPTALVLTVTGIDATCGAATGSASAIVSGGASPYSYLWSISATVSQISNLISQIYSVIVTDANNCLITASVVVGNTAGPGISLVLKDSVSCNALCDGYISINASGGSSPYSFLWSNGSTALSTGTGSVTGLCAGTYSVVITDNGGCTASDSYVVGEPSLLSVLLTNTDLNCNGGNDGTATGSTSGGTPPYNYYWSNGVTISVINNLSPNNYAITVTDANGCSAIGSVIINEPSALSFSVAVVNGVCGQANGSATANVSGGTSPYIYLWSNGASASSIYNLSSIIYNLIITDANGCIITTTLVMNNGSGVNIQSLTSTSVMCYGGNDGSISVGITGGTAPYFYSWSIGATVSQISNLISQIYSVTVTDTNGCTNQQSIIINQPSPLTISITASATGICTGQNVTFSANISGGTQPYNYQWNPGNQNALAINETPSATTSYSFSATDANGCVADSAITIIVGTLPTISITPDTTIILGTSVTLSVSLSGLSPVAYTWFPSTALNCNTCSSPMANPEQNTTYCVEVNNNGCIDTVCVNITINTSCNFFIPTAYSPNADGENDLECIYMLPCYTEMEFKIFSRWGELLFKTKDPAVCWDGRLGKELLDAGVFYYTFSKTDKSGTKDHIKGTITLIR